MRGIHALQYIEITIQHATVCYSAFELKFWTLFLGKSLIWKGKLNFKLYKQLITIQLGILQLQLTQKFSGTTTSVKPVEQFWLND